MPTIVWIALGLAALLVLWFGMTFNMLVHARTKVSEAFSGIDVQLRQRHDLVPNLVAVVSAYAEHEQGVMQEAAKARTEAQQSTGLSQTELTESRLTTALIALAGLAEGYPTLLADEEFRRCQHELIELEDEIEASRKLYNSNVEFFNTKVLSIPTAWVAGMTGFKSSRFFEAQLASNAAPEVAMT